MFVLLTSLQYATLTVNLFHEVELITGCRSAAGLLPFRGHLLLYGELVAANQVL